MAASPPPPNDGLLEQLEADRQARAAKQAATDALDAKLHKLYYKYELKLNDTQLRLLRSRRRANEFAARRMKAKAKADRLAREEEEEQHVAASMIQARFRGNKTRRQREEQQHAAAAPSEAKQAAAAAQ